MPSSSTLPTDASAALRRERFGAAWAALRHHRWFVGCLLLSMAAFAWVSTGGTGKLIAAEPLADFYDYQAASLLKGRLDVPLEALSFEAFAYQGKYYGYFGVTPALLRLPFVALGIGFGQLSRLYLLAYFTAALLGAYALLLHARRACSGAETPPAPPPWLVVLLVGNAGVGTTLFLVSSRAYVYHEAILCGAAFALWSIWCALRHFAAPARRWWIAALVLGLLAVHTRPPTGLFALTTVGVVACGLALRQWRAARAAGGTLAWPTLRHPLLLAVLAALCVLSFNGMSYLKFDTFNGCPLQYHVQYHPSFDPGRLARFEGKQFHLTNIPFVLDGYLLRPNFAFSPYFPFVLIGGGAPNTEFPRAKMDWVEPTLGFPYAMPGLFLLATLGAVAAFWRHRLARPALLLVWLGGVPMTLAMLAAVAMAHRYTADFCPLLICSGVFGLAALEQAAPPWRRFAGALVALLTTASVILTLLVTLYYQGERLWGVPEQARTRYATLRQRADSLVGKTNPAGYSTRDLAARRVDASYQVWIMKGCFQQPAEKLERGVAIYEAHLSEQVWFADVHFAMAELYLQRKQIPKALHALERGLTADPNQPKWQASLGELLAAQDRTPEAIARYRAALQLQPNFPAAHNNIAAAYAKIGRLDEALRHLETAYQLDPEYPLVRDNLARVRAALKKTP